MNLLVKKFGYLAAMLLITLLVISCEDPGKIGILINEDNAVISTHYYETVIPTAVVQFNPRKTFGSTSIQVGQYQNNDFGTVTAKSYSWLSLQPDVDIDDEAEFVSFEMEIAFVNAQGEPLLSNYKQNIDIYQLSEYLDPNVEYTSVDELATNSSPLATWDFIPLDDDTLQTDSTYLLPLSKITGGSLFNLLKNDDPIFDSDTTFNEYFKGIAFLPSTINYNIFFLNREKVVFRINYNEFSSDGTPVAREFEMRLSPVSFHHIKSDFSGTAISGIMPDNTLFFPSDDHRYMQFGTMLAIHGDLTPILPWMDTLENMIINKAELSIAGVNDYEDYLEPPNYIQTYFTNELNDWPIVDETGRLDTATAGQSFIMLQNEEQLTTPGYYGFPQSSVFDTTKNSYRVDMTFFLQNFFQGKFYSEADPFLEEQLQVLFYGESSVFAPEATASHVLTNPLKVPKDSIRLKVFYTIPAKQE